MLSTIEHNLQRGITLLNAIDQTQYTDKSVAPYYASIGTHMRHILDMFDCIFFGITTKSIDLTARKRNELVETQIPFGINYFEETIAKLNSISQDQLEMVVAVTDDLGNGKETINYTLASILAQAHSHAIHHYASVGYIIAQLGVELPFKDFGFNPSTPLSVKSQ